MDEIFASTWHAALRDGPTRSRAIVTGLDDLFQVLTRYILPDEASPLDQMATGDAQKYEPRRRDLLLARQ